MGNDDGDVDLLKKYKEVCADLNLDKASADEAWQSFQRIGINYTLEVSIVAEEESMICPSRHVCLTSL